MDILRISVHPKGSSACACWRCPRLCKRNVLSLLVPSKHHCQRCLCGRQVGTNVAPPPAWRMLSSRIVLCISDRDPEFLSFCVCWQKLEVVFSGNTPPFSSQPELDQSFISMHSLPKIIFLIKSCDKQLLCTSSFPYIYVTLNFTRHNKLFNYEQGNCNIF